MFDGTSTGHQIPAKQSESLLREDSIRSVSPVRRCMSDPQNMEFLREEEPSIGPTETPRLSPRSTTDIVQFSAALFFVAEKEMTARIDIMRIGRAAENCSVQFYTREGTAKDGKFSQTEKVVEFSRGEVLKTVEVPIHDDSYFDTTLEFGCFLADTINCHLGRYLCTSRVMILDDDVFPHNQFRHAAAMLDRDTEAAEMELSRDTLRLLARFIHFTFSRVPTLWWKTALFLLLDQLHNCYYLAQICIKMYLVDVVLAVDDESTNTRLLIPGNRSATALALAGLWLAPNLALLVVDRLKAGPLDAGRPARVYLQANLFRKYLNYSESSLLKVPMQDLTVTMNCDIPMLVEDGYCIIFRLARDMGKILVVAILMLSHSWMSVLPFLIHPIAMIIFIRVRQEQNVDLEETLLEAEEASEGCIMSASESFTIIRDYRMRHGLTLKFEARLSDSFNANNLVRVFQFWNGQFVPWISFIFIAVTMVCGSEFVLAGAQSLGTLLAMLEIYKDLGDRFQGIYDNLTRGALAGAPLVQVMKMLNLPTDVSSRMNRSNIRRAYTKEHLESDGVQKEGALIPLDVAQAYASIFDQIPLQVKDLKVSHVKALSGLNVRIFPSQVVFVTGSRAAGKATLLRIISGLLEPRQGTVVFASHARVLDVDRDPQVLSECDLYSNLTFGTHRPDPDRVRRIFKRLELDRSLALMSMLEAQIERISRRRKKVASSLSRFKRKGERRNPGDAEADLERVEQELLAESDGEAEQGRERLSEKSIVGSPHWYKELSFSERQRIHLARALIFNPETLVVHRAVDGVDDPDVAIILRLLRGFVDERGVELDRIGHFSRRPRTVFFSGGQNSSAKLSASISDEVWRFTNSGLETSRGGAEEVEEKDPSSTAAAGSAVPVADAPAPILKAPRTASKVHHQSNSRGLIRSVEYEGDNEHDDDVKVQKKSRAVAPPIAACFRKSCFLAPGSS